MTVLPVTIELSLFLARNSYVVVSPPKPLLPPYCTLGVNVVAIDVDDAFVAVSKVGASGFVVIKTSFADTALVDVYP